MSSLWEEIHAAHPRVRDALVADARLALRYRGEGHDFSSRLDAAWQMVRLSVVSDAFLAQACYRCKARLQALRVPLLPRVLHRLAMMLAGVAIGDPVVMEPGVYIVHGQVAVDGVVRIGCGVVLAPFVTVGLRPGDLTGPVLEEGVQVGTGARVLGRLRVGAGAQIAANAVVLSDVPPGAVVAGAPAREVGRPGTTS